MRLPSQRLTSSSPGGLLLAAAIFHVLVTLGVYALAQTSYFNSVLEPNGIATSFAYDGMEFHMESAELSETFAKGGFAEWFKAASPFHVKLYSICFILLGPLIGQNILSVEPLNLIFYLMILVLVFYLGKEVVDERGAFIATVVIGLWPTFVLHTTQLLRDPAFLTGMLAFILINTRFLSQNYSWWQALLSGVAGGLSALFVWLSRDNMGELLIITAFLTAMILGVKQFSDKRFRAANCVGVVLLMALSIAVTRFVPEFGPRSNQRATVKRDGGNGTNVNSKTPESDSANPLTRFAARAGAIRNRFTSLYPDATSNLDANVQIQNVGDVLRYLPRAAMVGFFAPFPNMWFESGSRVGVAGRLLSGIEMLAIYLVEVLALIYLWGTRNADRRFSVWLLALIACSGIISLGLVVVNVGALYRLRYLFFFLLVILGVAGATQISNRFRSQTPRSQSAD